LQRILFRFAFAYLLLYNLFAGNSLLRGLWDPVVRWVGDGIFGAEIALRLTGSGDTAWDYVQVFCLLMTSLGATLVWSLLDRKRSDYGRMHEGLRVFLRFSLAITMIMYGAVKAIPVQMPSPSLDRLLQPFGNASPMGLLWTFMGASAGYCIFTGVAEMLGGLLLTVRRTTLLGTLICVGVLANVAMLNYCYDVPVKLLSTHLLITALFLVAPDLRRLTSLFVLGRRAQHVPVRPLFTNVTLHRTILWLRTGLIAGFTCLVLLQATAALMIYGELAPRPPLYGIWTVKEFQADGEVKPLLITDATCWRRMVFDQPGVVSIYACNDAREYYRLELDEAKKLLTITKFDDAEWKATLRYKESVPDRLTVEGTFDGKEVVVELQRTDESQFLLVSRGFHWISEKPFNR
jgi:hypothetical protein